MKRLILAALAMSLLIIGCKKPVREIAVSSVSLDKSSLTLVVGDSQTLVATVNPTDATDPTVTWSSDKPSIATVSKDGKVTAIAEGEAIVTANAGNKSATCRVTVEPKVIPVESVTLDQTSITLTEGEEVTLVATVKPDDATNKTVTWSTDKESVATISNDGKIKAVSAGEAIITAKADAKTATCKVIVKEPLYPVEAVALNTNSADLLLGHTIQLVATITPENASNKNLSWNSSDEAIATVSDDGLVTAVAEGSAVITVKTADGGKTAECQIIVKPAPITAIAINPATLKLIEGKTEQLTVEFTPATSTAPKLLEWASVDDKVASVDQNGLVTAVAEGSTSIVARLKSNTSIQATCRIQVEKDVTLKGIAFTATSVNMSIGESQKLTINYNPAYAANKNISSWVSSNPAVVSVTNDGTLTALAKGTSTITATSEEGGFTASCEVLVSTKTAEVYYLQAPSGVNQLFRDGNPMYNNHRWLQDFDFYKDDIYAVSTSGISKNGKIIKSFSPYYQGVSTISPTEHSIYFTSEEYGTPTNISKLTASGDVINLSMNDVKERQIDKSVTSSDGRIYYLGYDESAFNESKIKIWELNPQTDNISEIVLCDYWSARYDICIDGNDDVWVIAKTGSSIYTIYKNGAVFEQLSLSDANHDGISLNLYNGDRYIAYITTDKSVKVLKNNEKLTSIELGPQYTYIYIIGIDFDSEGNLYTGLFMYEANWSITGCIFQNDSMLYSGEGSVSKLIVR